MGTILDSTKELSKKLGVEAEEQTIKDQIDAINESIDENFGGSVDIAEAVKTYSENAGGGATYAFSSMPVFITKPSGNGISCYNPIDDNGTFNVTFDNHSDPATSFGSIAILSQPAKKVNITERVPTGEITFTPAADFDGFYNGNTKKIINW